MRIGRWANQEVGATPRGGVTTGSGARGRAARRGRPLDVKEEEKRLPNRARLVPADLQEEVRLMGRRGRAAVRGLQAKRAMLKAWKGSLPVSGSLVRRFG